MTKSTTPATTPAATVKTKEKKKKQGPRLVTCLADARQCVTNAKELLDEAKVEFEGAVEAFMGLQPGVLELLIERGHVRLAADGFPRQVFLPWGSTWAPRKSGDRACGWRELQATLSQEGLRRLPEGARTRALDRLMADAAERKRRSAIVADWQRCEVGIKAAEVRRAASALRSALAEERRAGDALREAHARSTGGRARSR